MVESIRCLKKAGLDLLSQEDAAQQRLIISFRRCPNALLGVSAFFNSQAHAANFFALIALNFKDFELASR